MGTKSEKIVKKKKGLLSLFGRDSSKREKRGGYNIVMEDIKEKSRNAPRIGATHVVTKELGGDR